MHKNIFFSFNIIKINIEKLKQKKITFKTGYS